MGLYRDGYHEALKKVDGMTEAECLDVLDALHGRDDLEHGDGIEDLRAEVRRQYRREYRNNDDGRWGLIKNRRGNPPLRGWEGSAAPVDMYGGIRYTGTRLTYRGSGSGRRPGKTSANPGSKALPAGSNR